MTEQVVTFGAAAARVLLDAGIDVLDCDGDSCLETRKYEHSESFPQSDMYAPFRLADPDAELTEEQAEAVCKAQEGLNPDVAPDYPWELVLREADDQEDTVIEQVTFGAAAARALKAAGVDVVDVQGHAWNGTPACCPHDGSRFAPFRLADSDSELSEEQAKAVCEAQEGLVADGGGDLYKRRGGEWQWWSGRDWLFFPVSPPCNVARWEPGGRTFRLVPDPSKAEERRDRYGELVASLATDDVPDEELGLFHKDMRLKNGADIREIAARAAAESRDWESACRGRFAGKWAVAEQPEPEEPTPARIRELVKYVLPRTTRLLSEAVLHAEADGVVEDYDGDLFRWRNGQWEMYSGSERGWEIKRAYLGLGGRYTLHPADYLDDAPEPEKVEPKRGADFRRWLVETGRVGVDDAADKVCWGRDEAEFQFMGSEGRWVSYGGPADNDTGLPESGTWESEQ